jgi:hypothetical protein
MCLPKFVTEGFPLAAITVTEGYVDHSEFWGRYLKSDHQPILLKPGECLVLGESLDGYDFDDIKPMPRKLELKPNRTYTFEFHHAYLYATRFSATFCTSPNAAGGFDYLQYVRLPVNMKITPSCDARLNGNAPEPVHPLIYPR